MNLRIIEFLDKDLLCKLMRKIEVDKEQPLTLKAFCSKIYNGSKFLNVKHLRIWIENETFSLISIRHKILFLMYYSKFLLWKDETFYAPIMSWIFRKNEALPKNISC